MIRMSKKNRETLRKTINSCMVWNDYAMRYLSTDHEKSRYGMDRYNEYANQLNELIGTDAMHLFGAQ